MGNELYDHHDDDDKHDVNEYCSLHHHNGDHHDGHYSNDDHDHLRGQFRGHTRIHARFRSCHLWLHRCKRSLPQRRGVREVGAPVLPNHVWLLWRWGHEQHDGCNVHDYKHHDHNHGYDLNHIHHEHSRYVDHERTAYEATDGISHASS